MTDKARIRIAAAVTAVFSAAGLAARDGERYEAADDRYGADDDG